MSGLTIMLIRHGEKPVNPDGSEGPDLGPGLTEVGVTDKSSLVIRGWQRAGAWAALFGSGLDATDFPKPDVVYAADPNKPPTDDDSISKRPYETILPLCERLQIKPVLTYGVGDEGLLLDEIRKLTGVVLIAWEHKKIGQVMLPNLAQGQTLPQLPAKWKKSRFDVVLRFDRGQTDAPWRFRQLFPRLLGGDSETPM